MQAPHEFALLKAGEYLTVHAEDDEKFVDLRLTRAGSHT
jgi:hypothetical protein